MNKTDKDFFNRVVDDERKFDDVKSRPNRVKTPYKRDHTKVNYEDYTDDDSGPDFTE